MSKKDESNPPEPPKAEPAKSEPPKFTPSGPDFRAISKGDAKESKFPADIDMEYRVFINENAYTAMKAHTATTSEVELCGVLIGDVCHDSVGFYLKIDATIEGKAANNTGAQVTFTHQTWDHINGIKDKQYPNQRIVGWYHTHPGFGIFLSGMDLFIQQSYFNHPYQVAIVVETKQMVEGCFAWINGKSMPLTRYWVGGREVKLATSPEDKFEMSSAGGGSMQPERITIQRPSKESGGGGGWLAFFTALLMGVCGFLMGGRFAGGSNQETLTVLQSEMYSMIAFAAVNQNASSDLNGVREKLAAIEKMGKQNDSAGVEKSIKELSEHLAALEKTYNVRPMALRAELATLQLKKQSLGERITEQNGAIGTLYFLRLKDLVEKNGQAVDPATLTQQERQTAKILMTNTVALAPIYKDIIVKDYAKFIDYVEKPASDASTTAAPSTAPAPTPESTTKPK